MNTVVARFHHESRNIDDLESALVRAGVDDALITGYTVALTFRDQSEGSAVEKAHRALDVIGATRIKIRRRKVGPPEKTPNLAPEAGGAEPVSTTREDQKVGEATADLMAKIEMGVFGHP